MAYEPSEGLYAGASFLSTNEMNKARQDPAAFDSLYEKILSNLEGGTFTRCGRKCHKRV